MYNHSRSYAKSIRRINRNEKPIRLKQGLARLAQLAFRKGVNVQVVPVGLGYSEVLPKPLSMAAICFEEPLKVSGFGKKAVEVFNKELAERMDTAEQAALMAVGRFKKPN